MDPLRIELIQLLRGGQAYEPLKQSLSEFEPESRGIVPPGAERSAWQIVDHMRIAQRDILDFAQNESGTYSSKLWPDEYWPESQVPADGEWDRAVADLEAGLDEFERLLRDPARDLAAPFPWAEGQNLLREVLVAADHAAYHLGQLVELKRWIDADRQKT